MAAPAATAHLIIVDRDRWVLYEMAATRWNASSQRWEANVGAIFDLASNARRPEEWTSSDAAGLAILPGLVRYDEAVRGPIRHAMRVTVRATNGYVWPASHRAGNTAGALPMGARLRLKASKDLSSYPSIVRNIFRGMQTHGLIVADNGTDLYVSGAMDARWNNDELNPAFRALTPNDFEVITPRVEVDFGGRGLPPPYACDAAARPSAYRREATFVTPSALWRDPRSPVSELRGNLRTSATRRTLRDAPATNPVHASDCATHDVPGQNLRQQVAPTIPRTGDHERLAMLPSLVADACHFVRRHDLALEQRAHA